MCIKFQKKRKQMDKQLTQKPTELWPTPLGHLEFRSLEFEFIKNDAKLMKRLNWVNILNLKGKEKSHKSHVGK